MSRSLSMYPDDMVQGLKVSVELLQPVADAAREVVKSPTEKELSRLKDALDAYDGGMERYETTGETP